MAFHSEKPLPTGIFKFIFAMSLNSLEAHHGTPGHNFLIPRLG